MINLKTFSKEHWWVYAILILVLMIPLAIYCYVFYSKLDDASAWASLIAGVFTYIGASFLGIFIYYSTWNATKLESLRRNPYLQINSDLMIMNHEKGYFTLMPYDKNIIRFFYYSKNYFDVEKANFTGIRFTNQSKIRVTKIEPVNVNYIQDGKLLSCNDFCYSYADNTKKSDKIFIGIPNKYIKRSYYEAEEYKVIFLTFKITTEFQGVFYYINNFVYGKTLGGLGKYIISKEVYDERIVKNGHPIELNYMGAQFISKSKIGNIH